MPFEEFDNKLREAADNHHPGYDEKAWSKMNQLLDRHLPQQKKDRKGLLLLLLLFAVLAAGGYSYFYSGSQPSSNETIAVNGTDHKTGQPESPVKPATPEIPGKKTSASSLSSVKEAPVTNHENKPLSTPDKQDYQSAPRYSKLSPVNINQEPLILKKGSASKKPDSFKKGRNQSSFTAKNPYPLPGKTTAVTNANDPAPSINLFEKKSTGKTETNTTDTITGSAALPSDNTKAEDNKDIHDAAATLINQNEAAITVDSAKNISEKENPLAKKPKKESKIFFLLSGGVDISAVKWNPGKPEAVYGVGAGYKISDRVAVRTGFYAARKVYTAKAGEYTGAALNYYPNLKSVDGDCLVYEIPVIVDYSFNSSKNHSWFIGAGLSSLLMKRETYNYYYKPNYSQTYIYKERTITNQNKHYFSVADISGGYTLQLDKKLSLRAEPYLRIPLTGIGNGSVKLNSAGILFSAIIHPFNKK